MTICPIALAVGCKKCPIFAACPVKSVIGDQPAKVDPEPEPMQRKSGKKRRH